MYSDNQEYVRICREFQMKKESKSPQSGLLYLHRVPKAYWDVITMDFLSKFPMNCTKKDAVLVVVGKLSKRVIFIPMNKTLNSVEVVQLLFDHLFLKHGVPNVTILDINKQFKSQYFKDISQMLNVDFNMANISTGISPFEVEMGRVPESELSRKVLRSKTVCPGAVDYMERLKSFYRAAKDNLANAILCQEHYANQRLKHVEFQVEYLVPLKAEGTSSTRKAGLARKWQPKFMGPFAGLEVMGSVIYRIEPPPSMKKARNVLHV